MINFKTKKIVQKITLNSNLFSDYKIDMINNKQLAVAGTRNKIWLYDIKIPKEKIIKKMRKE